MNLSALVLLWLASAVAMGVVWLLAWRLRNAGYVDVAWAGLMAVAAVTAGLVGSGDPVARWMVAMLGGVWAARLSLHVLHRVLREPEDGRYRHLRTHWNGDQGRFFLFFQAQALFVAIFAIPFLVAADNPALPWPAAIAAGLVWLVAVAGETLADRQLDRFRSQPANRGRTCRVGLWAWSRHPNYFFEWLHWFAYPLLAWGSPLAWLALLGPAAMLLFLYRLTGIPWTEQQALRSRGEDYRAYQREVSAFLPWPPRR